MLKLLLMKFAPKLRMVCLPLFLFSLAPFLTSQPLSTYLQADFDFTAGSLSDGSANGIDGIGFDLSSAMGLDGSPNDAFLFNGTSSYIDLGTSNRNVTDQFTVSVWFKTSSTNGERQMIVSKYHFEDDRGYYVSMFNEVIAVGGRDGSGLLREITSGDTKVNDNLWHHVVFVADRNIWRLYLDCQLVNTLNTNTANPDYRLPDPLTIGKTSVSTGDGRLLFFDGSIDNVKLYNIALNEAEINEISEFTCPPGGFDPQEGLIAYYPLNGNALDLSGNELHGIINGPIAASDRFDLPGNCLEFDGEDDYILVPHSDVVDLGTGPFSISLWLQADDPGVGPQMLWHKGISGGGAQCWLRINDYEEFDPLTRLEGLVTEGNPPGTSVSSNLPLFDDQDWHFVLFQRTATHLELWVDGEIVAQLPDTQFRNVNNTESMIFGAQNPWPAGGNFPFIHNHFDGRLDEIRLYNKALSNEEIAVLANTYCPENLLIDEHSTYSFYQASGTISTSGDVTISNNTSFLAGDLIRLNAGFVVQAGVWFQASIEDCAEVVPQSQQATFGIGSLDESAVAQLSDDYLELRAVPNPFRSELQLSIELTSPTRAYLQLMDMNGRRIQLVFGNRLLESGVHVISLDLSDLTPGMYLLSLRTESHQLTKKIAKIR